MEQASSFRPKRHEEPDFNIKEWDRKARIIHENARSRRFSGSNLKSFRADAKSLTSSSGITISSTVSSPGYTIREEIDPSMYSFTTALKALQAKNVDTWEYLSPYGGYTLNSKWSDAEKYICNPLSGQVPLECLSTKTLRERSFRSLSNRITLSAPLIYQSQAKIPVKEHEQEVKFSIQEKKKSMTRDVGFQSTLVDLSSSSPSPTKTPSIEERSIKKTELEAEDSSLSREQLNTEETVQQVVQEAKETSDDHDRDEQKFTEKNAKMKVRKLPKMIMMMLYRCKREKESCSCLSRRNRNKQESK